jgi:hypothetical protein
LDAWLGACCGGKRAQAEGRSVTIALTARGGELLEANRTLLSGVGRALSCRSSPRSASAPPSCSTGSPTSSSRP